MKNNRCVKEHTFLLLKILLLILLRRLLAAVTSSSSTITYCLRFNFSSPISDWLDFLNQGIFAAAVIDIAAVAAVTAIVVNILRSRRILIRIDKGLLEEKGC